LRYLAPFESLAVCGWGGTCGLRRTRRATGQQEDEREQDRQASPRDVSGHVGNMHWCALSSATTGRD